MGEKLIPIEGLPPDLARLPAGCSFYPRCTYRIDKCREEYPPLQLVARTSLRRLLGGRDGR